MDTITDTGPVTRTLEATPRVLCVDTDTEYLALLKTAFEDDESLSIRTETDPDAVEQHLDDVACVVAADHLADTAGRDIFEVVRSAAPDQPFLRLTTAPLDETNTEFLSCNRTDVVSKGWERERVTMLAQRIHALVANQRLDTLAQRYWSAIEMSREPTLVVSPDGNIEWLNKRLDIELAFDRSTLVDRRWDVLFTDESAAHLRTTAFPVIERGWRWTGETTLAFPQGDTERYRINLTGLDDGGMVLSFHGLEQSNG